VGDVVLDGFGLCGRNGFGLVRRKPPSEPALQDLLVVFT
jgi:hypothetical protein